MKRFTINASIALVLGLGIALALLWSLEGGNAPAVAAPALSEAEGPRTVDHIEAPNAQATELHVCLSGCAYSSVQDAVDAASDGDVIKVAAGTYTGIQGRPAPAGYDGPGVITQVVYISKTVTVQGGYTTTNWTTPYPATQPTTLDAQGQGRVLFIGGDIAPTVEGLHITGGDAAGLGGGLGVGRDAGGGVYIINATATISDNQVFGNIALVGGGLYLYGSAAVLNSNTISVNTANGSGGGLVLDGSAATLTGNTVTFNTANASAGGLLLYYSNNATLDDNSITSNTANASGGGLFLYYSDSTTLDNNTITSNTANGSGGGLYLHGSATMLDGNTISANSAGLGGGGLHLNGSAATLINNTIRDNTANQYGGGLILNSSDNALLSDNTISANSTGLGGGGLFLNSSTAALTNNTVTANTTNGNGGGLFLSGGGNTMLIGNTISANSASQGGGLDLSYSPATLISNTISANTAINSGGGLHLSESAATLSGNIVSFNAANGFGGGGLLVAHSDATLDDNTIFSNATAGSGGGLHVEGSAAMLTGNTVSGNTAWEGGGLYLTLGASTLISNTISGNTATDWGGGGVFLASSTATLDGNTVSANTANDGGGLFLTDSPAALSGNTISGNTTPGWGGGLFLSGSDATLDSNTVISNTASDGSGLWLHFSDATLTNNVVADNQATSEGNGLSIIASSPHLLHTTIARNTGGVDNGIYVTHDESNFSAVTMINTILVDHTTGIYVESGDLVTLESTLWNGNDTDWDGDGTIDRSNDHFGDPAFVDPDAGDYHIGSASAARNAGIEAGVQWDMDGQSRPMDWEYDIGADEYPGAGLNIVKTVTPDAAAPGWAITYTLTFFNAGSLSATGVVITDHVPASVTDRVVSISADVTITDTGATPAYVWQVADLAPGQGGTITIVGRLSDSLPAGTLTNAATIAITGPDGVPGSSTSSAGIDVFTVFFGIEKTSVASNDPLNAGDTVAYTVVVSNPAPIRHTGVAISDTIPLGLTYVPGSGQVSAPTLVPSSIFYDFESGAEGWTTGADDGTPPINWELGVPTTRSPLDGGNCSADCWGNGGPDDDHTPDAGINAWGTDLDDLYPNNIGGIYLYSPVLDLSGKTNVQLSFWEWLEIEALTWDQARLEYSVNGGVWTVIFQTVDTPTRLDSAWSQFTHDASSYADDQPQVQWRWSLDSDTAWQAAGWYIDDVEISFDSVGIVTQPAGDPPDFVTAADGYNLSPGETMTLTFLATVDDPISSSHITNTASVSSIQATVPVTDDVVNLTNIAPELPPYQHRCRWRHEGDYFCD